MRRCLPIILSLLVVASANAAARGDEVRFAILGDRTGGAVPGIYESVLEQVDLLGPSFVVTVGDQIEGYTEDSAQLRAQWQEFHSIVGRLSAPYYPCAGNHDITYDGMLPAWKEAIGREPSYSFDQHGIHFVILDTSRWETSDQWMKNSGYADWLGRDLEKNRKARLTVVIFHKPYWYDTLAEGRGDPMHQLFREMGVDYVFNGHFHNYAAGIYDGIHYTIVGSSGGSFEEEDPDRGIFFQFVWCAFRGDSLDWRVIRRDGVLASSFVTVADQKFLDRVGTEYIEASPCWLPENEDQRTFCYLTVHNLIEDTLTVIPSWEATPGWTMKPAEMPLVLEPTAIATLPFQAILTGEIFPLPHLRFDYPYKAGKVFHYDTILPLQRVQTAGRATSPPTIDGRLDESIWSDSSAAREFGSPDGKRCTIEPTTIYFRWDAENLYLAARCRQEDGAPVAQASERDGTVFRDDCVGFFFCPDTTRKTFYQIYFNASGTVFDQKVVVEAPGQYGGDLKKWNGEYTVAVGRIPGEWTLEAAIPFRVLETRAPWREERWRVNFRRKEIARGSSADWNIPIGYEPAQFGFLRFY